MLCSTPEGDAVYTVPAGSWLGVIDEAGDWYRVVSARHDGWIRKDQTTDAPHFSLRAVVSRTMADLVQNYALF